MLGWYFFINSLKAFNLFVCYNLLVQILKGGDFMKIEHIGLFVSDLEAVRVFYTKYFNGSAGAKYG